MTGNHVDQPNLADKLDKRAVWWGRGTIVSLAGLVLLAVIMLTQWAGNHSQDSKIHGLESHGKTQDQQISVLQSVANANASAAKKAGGTPVPVPQFTTPAQLVPVPGPTGPLGGQGPAGSTGPKGDRGEPGSRGPQGLKGDTGTGMPGPVGENGGPGPAGPAGPQGAPGPAGADGRDGTNGTDGATGPQGPPGPDECTHAGGTWTTQPPALPGEQAQLVCTLPSTGGN